MTGLNNEQLTDLVARLHELCGDKFVSAGPPLALGLFPMSLRLAWGSGSEAVDLEASGDADDAGLIFAGGEVAGLFGGAGAGLVGGVADEESGVEDLEQERGQGQVKILRGKSTLGSSRSRRPARAGS